MIKKIFMIFSIMCSFFVQVSFADEDPFLFDNFAIEDSKDTDINTSPVSVNIDSSAVNVSGFDIAGIILGMPFEDVQTLFFKTKSLYVPRKKNSIIYTMHKDWKYNLDYECRQQKIYNPTELEKCINTLARSRGLLYASELHLIRESTGETVDVYFTSNATDNLVWRVVYKNDVNEVEGANEKFENQRQKKILAFWQGVLDKYGAPNSGNDKWVSSGNAYDPMMTAYYGSLDLNDMGRNASDAAKNVQQARENFRTKPYAF
ncbi:MAG: hypothetical protein JW974_01100 [Alphaproteobacteria bacterium]|nr:hypothetical protein [Alphaproteobacteria bacterium]MBN2675384.1 hypothetical protein [Alphaproteobacteria bacterium]